MQSCGSSNLHVKWFALVHFEFYVTSMNINPFWISPSIPMSVQLLIEKKSMIVKFSNQKCDLILSRSASSKLPTLRLSKLPTLRMRPFHYFNNKPFKQFARLVRLLKLFHGSMIN